MLDFLLHLLLPGTKFPEGTSSMGLDIEGLSWGWAFLLWLALAAASYWGYRQFAPGLTKVWRTVLLACRFLFLAGVVLILVHPVLRLTIEDPGKHVLLVLLDLSQSMGLQDIRETPDDQARAAIAIGAADPSEGLKAKLPSGQDGAHLSRQELLTRLAGNAKLNLWPKLAEKTKLVVYGFGRQAHKLDELNPANTTLTTAASADYFKALSYSENQTAIGDSLKSVLADQESQAVGGVFLITDGSNNAGSPPFEGANLALQQGVPLYVYGVGVTTPRDFIVDSLTGPPTVSLKEKGAWVIHLRSNNMVGTTTTLQLKADGKVVAEQPYTARADGEQEVTMNYTGKKVGEVELEAVLVPTDKESLKNNNSAKTKVRIVDDKLRVLVIQNEPNWDFEYLMTMLQRDRRVRAHCVLLNGDHDLASGTDSIYLDSLPEDRATLLANDLIILGSVSPDQLGANRMQWLSDWVNQVGGGLVFWAAPPWNPSVFAHTPLDPLIPVQGGTQESVYYDKPVQLELTAAGRSSPMLTLANNPDDNQAIWNKFAGVRWTCWCSRARPAGQVLLVDPTPDRRVGEDPLPVMVLQGCGQGQTLYVGTNETFRWRSKLGEKYYTQIWGQIVETLAHQEKQGDSGLIKLRTDKVHYQSGEKVKISGRIMQAGFTPLTDAEVPALVVCKGTGPGSGEKIKVSLQAVPNQPGEYRGQMVAAYDGMYTLTLPRDPTAMLKFDASEPAMEMSDSAMNEGMLRSMAESSGGRFLREEDLRELPAIVGEKTVESATIKRLPLIFSPSILALLIVLACVEWAVRRKCGLK